MLCAARNTFPVNVVCRSRVAALRRPKEYYPDLFFLSWFFREYRYTILAAVDVASQRIEHLFEGCGFLRHSRRLWAMGRWSLLVFPADGSGLPVLEKGKRSKFRVPVVALVETQCSSSLCLCGIAVMWESVDSGSGCLWKRLLGLMQKETIDAGHQLQCDVVPGQSSTTHVYMMGASSTEFARNQGSRSSVGTRPRFCVCVCARARVCAAGAPSCQEVGETVLPSGTTKFKRD